MNKFVEAVTDGITETTNGMSAFQGTKSRVLDFFYLAPSLRSDQTKIKELFIKAYEEDHDLALRVTKWLRDIRGGAGERESFRTILKYLAEHDLNALAQVVPSIPKLGRWDDLWSIVNDEPVNLEDDKMNANKIVLLQMIEGFRAQDALLFKWMPRRGKIRSFIQKSFGWSPKFYRHAVVEGTICVETQMCANEWEDINYSHVPSIASARYRKAFWKHSPERYGDYLKKLEKAVATQDFSEVKVNASAIFPHEVLPKMSDKVTEEVKSHAKSQWACLPNYVESMNLLPIIDSSGSMTCSIPGSYTPLEIARALGLYMAEKNKGVFKDIVCTFSEASRLVKLAGDLFDKLEQIQRLPWGMNTNFEQALNTILLLAKRNKVPQEDMPKGIIILSDMQFDYSVRNPNHDAMSLIEEQYIEAGYQPPIVIFWNLGSYDNVPIQRHKSGAVLFSGYSPALMKGLIETDGSDITPYGMMLQTVMSDRYA